MPKFSANLSMLFREVAFLDRFAQASKAGFRGVECQFPYAHDKHQIADQLDAHGLTLVLHNLPAGDWDAGERGIACMPDRRSEFQDGVGTALEYASLLGCPQLNCLAGITPAGVTDDQARASLIANLRFAAAALAGAGIRLLIEPLNTRDTPGFFLQTTRQALELMREVNSPNLFLQYDCYHMQIMEGDLANTIAGHLERIAHVQFADAPGRHEPGTGEIDFTSIFSLLDRIGYTGWMGAEYTPLGRTEDGLGWFSASP
jgi:hydroxypyruvate isomerase